MVPFCRLFQAQSNGICLVRRAITEKKLRTIEILDIFAWEHYICGIAVPSHSLKSNDLAEIIRSSSLYSPSTQPNLNLIKSRKEWEHLMFFQ